MGNTPFTLKDLSSESISDLVRSLGNDYNSCADIVGFIGMNGAYILAMAADGNLLKEVIEVLTDDFPTEIKPLRGGVLREKFTELLSKQDKENSLRSNDINDVNRFEFEDPHHNGVSPITPSVSLQINSASSVEGSLFANRVNSLWPVMNSLLIIMNLWIVCEMKQSFIL